MFKTPSEAIVLKDKKGNIKNIVTPYDDNNTLQNPINYVGEENKKRLKVCLNHSVTLIYNNENT